MLGSFVALKSYRKTSVTMYVHVHYKTVTLADDSFLGCLLYSTEEKKIWAGPSRIWSRVKLVPVSHEAIYFSTRAGQVRQAIPQKFILRFSAGRIKVRIMLPSSLVAPMVVNHVISILSSLVSRHPCLVRQPLPVGPF